MSDARRIERIRVWRDQTRSTCGKPIELGDDPIVINTKAWWKDVDTLLNELDAKVRDFA